MRKYKQVKEKKITFDMKQWAEVERRADACNKTTTSFIRDKAVSSEVRVLDLKGLAPLINGMRTISNNINQIARKANETNNLYAGDVEKLRKEVECLSHSLLKTHNNKTHVITSIYPPATIHKKTDTHLYSAYRIFDYK